MSKIHILNNGKITERDATVSEQAEIDAREVEFNSDAKKLADIKVIRLKKLQETDWWVLRGEMSSQKTAWRKSLRDIPTTYSASDYDSLLARDSDGKLTHSIWSKP